MTRPLPEISPDPLGRFIAIANALEQDRSWTAGVTPLRFTAVSLVTTQGSPDAVARGLKAGAEALKDQAGWTSPLRSSIRFLIAAILMRDRVPVEQFDAACSDLADGLKTRKMKWGKSAHAVLASLILLNHDEGRILPKRLDRMAAIFAGMKEHHPWITTMGDYAPCAVLATTETPVDEMMRRIESAYEGLRERGYSRGDPLQRASHLLFFNPSNDHTAVTRFDALFKQFKEAGLWMHGGDYDEMAILSFLDASPASVVETVLRHREEIAAMKPRPGKEMSFSLACGTAFLALAQDADSDVLDATRLMQLQSMLDAQTACMAASTAAVAASNS